MYEILRKMTLFNGLSGGEIEHLISSVVYNLLDFPKDKLIVMRGEKCDKLMLLLSGSVKGEMSNYSTKTINIERIIPPVAIASAFIFAKKNQYPVDIITSEDSRILVLPKKSVLKMFETSSIFLKNFLEEISNKAFFLTEKIDFISFKTIREKLALYFLKYEKDNKLVFNETIEELSGFFGVTRPSLSREIKNMINDRLIEKNNYEINILAKDKLVEIIRE